MLRGDDSRRRQRSVYVVQGRRLISMTDKEKIADIRYALAADTAKPKEGA
jgi:hypothetical protein